MSLTQKLARGTAHRKDSGNKKGQTHKSFLGAHHVGHLPKSMKQANMQHTCARFFAKRIIDATERTASFTVKAITHEKTATRTAQQMLEQAPIKKPQALQLLLNTATNLASRRARTFTATQKKTPTRENQLRRWMHGIKFGSGRRTREVSACSQD